MNKGELIEYLSACIDAEQGVYETDRLVSELYGKVYDLEKKDYNSGEIIPKPKLEPLNYPSSYGTKPELVLESEDGYKEKIEELEAGISIKRKTNYKIRIVFGIVLIVALVILSFVCLSHMYSDSFTEMIDNNLTAIFLLDLGIAIAGIIAFRNDNGLLGLGLFFPLVSFFLAYVAEVNGKPEKLVLLIVIAPLPILLFGSLCFFVSRLIASNKQDINTLKADEVELDNLKKEYSEIQERNEGHKKEYKWKLSEYEDSKNEYLEFIKKSNAAKEKKYALQVKNAVFADSLMIETLEAEQEKQEELNEKFSEELEILYSKNIVHNKFRNIAALSQLKEYLEMGVASELEGPDGAYNIYLADLRAQKVIDSVESLRKTIEAGITVLAHGQEVLYQEMIMANINLRNLSSDIDTHINKISHNIIDMKYDLEDAIRQEGYNNRNMISESINRAMEFSQSINEANQEINSAYLKQVVETQKNLLSTIEKSSYNQYLIQKKENVNNYLYFSLQDPR